MPVVPRKMNKEDASVIDSSTGKRVFDEANYYYEATMILEKERKLDELFPPVIMNATFACELFSKAILYSYQDTSQTREVIKGHCLKKLYDEFKDEDKSELRHLYKGAAGSRFDEWISDIDELFETWRYRYEYKRYATHYSFVLEYMDALKKLTESIYKNDNLLEKYLE